MNNKYNQNFLKNNWYRHWELSGCFYPDYKKKRNYCITIPPPNITGNLHMGHAFQSTLMDILIRYYRMNNYSVLWKVGADHAGIATQILIEQKLKTLQGKNFLNFTRNWKRKSIKNIISQLKNLGCSANWNTFRFTLDKHFSYAVNTAFRKLYFDNLIYKSKTIVNWDMKLKTAISDLEVVYNEENVNLYYIKYFFLNDKSKFIIVATTRPETIFADVAIAFNPDDSRYKNLHDKRFVVPLINRSIPVIYDNYVDKNFGTGSLKITPAHDFNDFKLGKKYNLPLINIFSKDGFLNDNVPLEYRNLDLSSAKKKIIFDLKQLDYIERINIYKTRIPVGDRSGGIIEPFITEQWYVKVDPLIKPVEECVKSGKVIIYPLKWKKFFYNWINNIKDWCISRQIWWGHRMPIWYDECKNVYLGENEKSVRKYYNLKSEFLLYQEKDVLDTWFSSALWPFASLGWPTKKIEFLKFYPTNTLITGFDIIFFWAIRMMMFGLKFTNSLPFKEIYIHGLIKDDYGNKMSKTKGNVLDPIDIIKGINYQDLIKKQTSNLLNEKLKEQIILNIKKKFPSGIKSFGADALRLSFASLATDSLSIKLDLEKFNKYKNFCNKILNASKFIIINKSVLHKSFFINNIFNYWIISIWQKIKFFVILNIRKRKFSYLSDILYDFFWNDFCSWYLEVCKIFITNIMYKRNIINNMSIILNEFLKILHPIAPYITEEIFYTLNKSKKLLINSEYPKVNKRFINLIVEKKVSFFKDFISKIRHFKSVLNFSNISIYFFNFSDLFFFEKIKNFIYKLTKIKNVYFSIKRKENFNLTLKNIEIFFIF